MNGVLNLDKPAGMTSHDVVARVRRAAKQKRVGHAGTLDPDATGVLLVCLGQATRLAEYLAEAGKEYRAVLTLGAATTTEDASGDVLAEADASHIAQADLEAVLPRFLGEILQTPPMVSAVHHEGKRLYELARQGVTVERAARPVRIDALRLLDFTPGPRARATLDVACGKGTYIRTLCADLGAALGVGGHMASLRRTRVGRFTADAAHPLETLTPEAVSALLVPSVQALADWPRQDVDAAGAADVRQGRAIPTPLPEGREACILFGDVLIALGRSREGRLHPFKVFPDEAA